MIRDIISLSETGLCRQKNQDMVLAVNTECTGLFAVADGMGGHYQGELASQTAINSLKEWWEGIYRCIMSFSFPDIVTDLERKIKEINQNIFHIYKEMGKQGGTTLCLLFLRNNTYVVMNVGDSRIYQRKGWSLMQITTDDVWENWMYRGRTEIPDSPYNGKLVQALGVEENLSIHVHTGLIRGKIHFFLCSDGIYKYCDSKYLFFQIKNLLWKKDMEIAIKKIKKKVYENGAKDNLSMILLLAEENGKS